MLPMARHPGRGRLLAAGVLLAAGLPLAAALAAAVPATASAATVTPSGTGRLPPARPEPAGLTGGTTVLDVSVPAGEARGPGTYQYPTAGGLHPGAFDLTRFQVISTGPTVYLRVVLAAAPSAADMGARLLDIYVHVPGARRSSTRAAAVSRGYTIAPGGAWRERVEVRGTAKPVWAGAGGSRLGTPRVLAPARAATLTIALPAARFGTPAAGWAFTVVLAAQNRSRAGHALGFARTPRPHLFGVCAARGTAPVCSARPATVPKVLDVLTPPGVDQTAELDPVNGPVVLQPVPVAAPGPEPALALAAAVSAPAPPARYRPR